MKNIFVNEDISKPENRVNLALFHLQMDLEFHEWFCQKLKIPSSCLIYPVENLSGERPDMIIKDIDKTVGYIEVELGDENKTQLMNYRAKYEKGSKKIYSITGKHYHNSDLGLDEIREYLMSRTFINQQTKLSSQYLAKLIEISTNHGSSYSRNPVSEEVLKKPFVKKLLDNLAEFKPNIEQKKPEPGNYYCDTNGPKGFSFRVYSPVASQKSVSLLSITKGRDYISFLSAQKYRKFLSHKPNADVENWNQFLSKKLLLPIDHGKLTSRFELSILSVTKHFDELIDHIKKLI